MRYVYVNDVTGTLKTHLLKINKALAKLQRDAVIISQINNTIYIADCSSEVAQRMLA